MSKPRGNEATLKKYLPTWKHGKTKTIRVPTVLAEQIFDYAKKIDTDEANTVSQLIVESNQGNLLPVIEMLEYVATAKRNNFSVEHRSKLSKAIDTLKQITK
ncbi:MAG: hypothetical protein DCF20_04250 [Pseudanabaena sp.]|nr:MAG: hypothetical protein DCF20_04250 [Pseudanabaena sp.]